MVGPRRARVDAELVHEPGADAREGAQRFRLAPVTVEGQHQLRPQALAQRVLGDERLELGHEAGVPPERQFGVDAQLECHEAQLLESCDRALGERRVGEVRERHAAPQPEGLLQVVDGARVVVRGERALAGREQALEPREVDLIRGRHQRVPGWARHEQVAARAQPLAQLRHADAQRGRPGRRRVLAPEVVHQPVRRHDLAVMHHEDRQQRPLGRPGDRD